MALRTTPQTPKGLAAIPGQQPGDEQTLSMIVALASEVTIIRARLDTCERLLTAKGVLEAGAVEAFQPDAEAQVARDGLRQRTMRKVFRAMQETAAADLAILSSSEVKASD